MRSDVQQADRFWQGMLQQVARCMGKQDLPTVPGADNAGGPMHIQPHIALGRYGWLAGVQPYAHPHRHAFWPDVGEEGSLDSYGRRNRIAGARKGYKEGIPLCVDLVAVPLLECLTEELPAFRQEAGVAVAELLMEACRSLDVGEEQCDRSSW